MYSVVEIDKTNILASSFVPYSPYVYVSTVSISAVATYWTTTFGADGTYNAVALVISSITIDGVQELDSQTSLADCLSNEKSFYFDFDNQLLYVHPDHTTNINAVEVAQGVSFGYCSDTVRYFKNQIYRPIVTSIPTISDSADPLQYGFMSFGGGSIVMVNDVEAGIGIFDTDEKLYGNEIRIKAGYEGDDYEDLVLLFVGYIKDYTTTTSTMTIEVADKRERGQVETPTTVFSGKTGIAEDSNGTLIPDGYGDVIQVPAYPITDNAGTVTFQWGTAITTVTQVYTLVDDILTAVNSDNVSTTGTFTLVDSACAKDGSDPTNGLLKVYVTGRMRDYDNPADIIADLNDRVMGVPYNTSNYNTTEWEAESASLSDIALYMDSPKKVYDWISLIQSGTNYGFRYEDRDKITLRLDDPDRLAITFSDGTSTIDPIDIRNSDMPIQQNAELYATSCTVKYSHNVRKDTYSQVSNTDYYDEVLREHRIAKVESYESLLTNSTDADSKALKVMQDISVVRPIFTITIDYDKLRSPRIYDIINATVSLLVHGDSIPTVWSFVLGSDDFVMGDATGVIGERHAVTRTDAYSSEDALRTYFGSVRGQIIGISPSPETGEVTLQIRQRSATI